jgi:hypothetical protein
MTVSAFDRYYAGVSDRNDRIEATRPHTYGGDKAITSLRAFQRYDRNATTDIFDLWGQKRWVTQKQSRIYAILRREAGSSSRLTMGMIALEADVATSSVSRAILKFQGWGIFAIDVTRGKYGGITVTLRALRDGLEEYARRAWDRIRKAADRARLMLRSRSLEGNEELSSTYLLKDATLKSEVSIERLGAAVLAGELSIAEARAAAGHAGSRPTEADLEWERANEWARQVIIERKRLDEEEPDWDLYLEAVRASYGLG